MCFTYSVPRISVLLSQETCFEERHDLSLQAWWQQSSNVRTKTRFPPQTSTKLHLYHELFVRYSARCFGHVLLMLTQIRWLWSHACRNLGWTPRTRHREESVARTTRVRFGWRSIAVRGRIESRGGAERERKTVCLSASRGFSWAPPPQTETELTPARIQAHCARSVHDA